MSTPPPSHSSELPEQEVLSSWITILLASACGLIVANLYYAQPLLGPIREALGLSAGAAGLVVTMTQIGYGAGLLLLVPLGDLFENRRLVLSLIGLVVLALLGAAMSTGTLAFLVSMLFIGLGSVAVQVLVPYAAHMSPEATRGRSVGNVMSGLMLGIMLARPLASIITAFSSWHVVFLLSAALMVLLALVLSRALPRRMPVARLSYGSLLASMWHLTLTTPVLRRRALYQAFLFGAFSLFWTTTPLLLASPQFGLSQVGIALFALAGVAGAIASPIAGRVADLGWGRPATAAAMALAALSFMLTHIGQAGSTTALAMLVCAAILLDFGVAANLTFGQRILFALSAEHRSRLNGLYMAGFFVGGALGSAIGGWAYAYGGWTLASSIGVALPLAALLFFATEPRQALPTAPAERADRKPG
jgi:predicted MFS family arabinose efflux permease